MPARFPRRTVLGLALLLVLGLLAACGAAVRSVLSVRPVDTAAATRGRAAASPAGTRPDILVIETDDMRWDDLRWMPNVRRLVAARGLSFEDSLAPNPLCAPSRSSLLTGQYSHHHHVYTHEEPYGFAAFHDQHTIATVLHGAGYRTALVGKYLNGYGEQFLRSGGSSLHYVPPGWDRWLAGSDHLWRYDDPRYGGGTYSYDHLVQNVDGRIEDSPGRYSTDVEAAQARTVVDGFAAEHRPWFVWWTPTAPHHGLPVEPDDPAPSRRLDGQFEEWDTPGRPAWVKGRFDRRITHGSGTPASRPAEAAVGDKPQYLRELPPLTSVERRDETVVTRQRAEALYALDVQVRRLLRHLRRTGQLAHTVVVFTSDNGYYLGEHRRRAGKTNLHEPSLRVPLLIAGPGVPHGRRYDPATTVDLAPTLAAYAGTTMAGADGTSLLPSLRRDRGWDRPVVTEGMMDVGAYADGRALGSSPLDTRGLRLGRWKLTRYSTGETELYDLLRDPLELHNLAADPRHAATLRQLETLELRYRDCREAACRATLPARWRLTPAQSRRVTEHEARVTERYYGD